MPSVETRSPFAPARASWKANEPREKTSRRFPSAVIANPAASEATSFSSCSSPFIEKTRTDPEPGPRRPLPEERT